MRYLVWTMVTLVLAGAIAGVVYWKTQDRAPWNPPSRPDISKPINNPEPGTGKQTYHMDVDGVRREFIVYRPDNIPESKEVPVVFMYHGSGGNGEVVYKETGWKQKADEEGFMVVYPTGLKYHLYQDEMVQNGVVKTDVKLYQSKWNHYGLDRLLDEDYPEQVIADDVKFTREMVEFVQKGYATDEARFYATGFSNGAQFTTRLMTDASDIFAAFAPTSAGNVPPAILAGIEAAPQRPEYRPVVQVIGADDAKLVHGTGLEELTHDESAAEDGDPVKDYYISGFIAAQGLTDAYTYEEVGNAAHFTYDQSLVGADNEYQIYIADNMPHIYPNGKNYRFDVADIYWEFFKSYTL